MRTDRERLLDMLEAIRLIEKYCADGPSLFDRDELVQTWVIHHLEILGEAARHVSTTTQQRLSRIPWSRLIGMRNILVHRYFGLDKKLAWSVVENELPTLRAALESAANDPN